MLLSMIELSHFRDMLNADNFAIRKTLVAQHFQ
jgi:hypothetical protein